MTLQEEEDGESSQNNEKISDNQKFEKWMKSSWYTTTFSEDNADDKIPFSSSTDNNAN